MAEQFKLPVYKAAIDLEKQFVLSTQKTPRRIKYTMVDYVYKSILDMPVYIAFANEYGGERLQWVEKAVRKMNDVKIHLRVMLDVWAINEHQFAVIMEKQENLSRQLYGWMKSLRNQQKG
ncbi:MAG: four helix bundle protein [Bacteroides sp.]